MSYGNQNTPDFSLWAGGTKGRWESSIGTELFHTDGYILVPEAECWVSDQKGRVPGCFHRPYDWPTSLARATKCSPAAGSLKNPAKEWNSSHNKRHAPRRGRCGGQSKVGKRGDTHAKVLRNFQTHHQSFSSVAANRGSESLTDLQTVPAQGIGASAIWSRTVGKTANACGGIRYP